MQITQLLASRAPMHGNLELFRHIGADEFTLANWTREVDGEKVDLPLLWNREGAWLDAGVWIQVLSNSTTRRVQ